MLRALANLSVIFGLLLAFSSPTLADTAAPAASEGENSVAEQGQDSAQSDASDASDASGSSGSSEASAQAEADSDTDVSDSDSDSDDADTLSADEAELAGCPPCPKCAAEEAEAEAEEAAPEEPAVVWAGSVGAGLLALSGNTTSLTTSANATVERRSKRWIFGLKANGTYGESTAVDEPLQVLAQSASLLLRTDFRFTKQLSYYLAAGADTDHVKSVEWRGTGETGLGYIILDRQADKRELLFLRTDLAFRYQYESRFQYFPTKENLEDVTLTAPRLAATFRTHPLKSFAFLQELEFLPNIGDEARFLVNSLSKVSVAVLERLSLTTSLLVQYDSAPAADRVPTDLTITVGLEVPFG